MGQWPGTQEREGKPEGSDGKDSPVGLSLLYPTATAWVTSYHTEQRVGVRQVKLGEMDTGLDPNCRLGSHPSLPNIPLLLLPPLPPAPMSILC